MYFYGRSPGRSLPLVLARRPIEMRATLRILTGIQNQIVVTQPDGAEAIVAPLPATTIRKKRDDSTIGLASKATAMSRRVWAQSEAIRDARWRECHRKARTSFLSASFSCYCISRGFCHEEPHFFEALESSLRGSLDVSE